MVHLYGHNYFGPGTDLTLKRRPVDKDDSIAQHHDEDYRSFRKGDLIRRSDTEAIGGFLDDWRATGNAHSLLGAVGLQTKQLAESAVGFQLYPWMKPKFVSPKEVQRQRPPTRGKPFDRISKFKGTGGEPSGNQPFDQPQPGPSNVGQLLRLVQNPVSPGQNMPQEGEPSQAAPSGSGPAAAPAAPAGDAPPGGNAAGGGGDTQPVVIESQDEVKGEVVTYSKRQAFYTFGYNYKKMKLFPDVAGVGNQPEVYVTPYACIPVWEPALYLSEAEYDSIPQMARALKITAQIMPIGFHTPFQTAASASTYANSQMSVMAAYGYGINSHIDCMAMRTFPEGNDATEIMSVDPYLPSYLYNMMYGELGTVSMGANRHLNCYTGFILDTATSPGKFEILTNYMEKFKFNDFQGTALPEFSYKFRNGLLHGAEEPRGANFSAYEAYGVQFRHSYYRGPDTHTWVRTQDQIKAERNDRHKLVRYADVKYQSELEKGAYCGEFDTILHSQAMPNMCVGLVPTLCSSANATTPKFAEVTALWALVTTMDVFIPHTQLNTAMIVWPMREQLFIFGDDLEAVKQQLNRTRMLVWIRGRRATINIPIPATATQRRHLMLQMPKIRALMGTTEQDHSLRASVVEDTEGSEDGESDIHIENDFKVPDTPRKKVKRRLFDEM